ncbi:Scavenger receptor class F member 1 [Apodemus speciosus]|uniref:Scavenger receptor class F member 1 n=1 Tax=Apodemus speciosus TaxID=105296 RepID=A0ABQ0FB33_APOSI
MHHPSFQARVGCFSAICEGPDVCRKDEVCVKPGLCRCKPGFFGAQCSSRAVQASTGATTVVRPAPAIHVASANRPPVCASASPTTGASSVSTPAPAAPTDSATQRRACAAAILAGGHLRVVAHASATQRRTVTRTLEPAYARRAGGAVAAVSAATATPRPACRTLAAASACRAGGVRSVVVGASVCEANAVVLRATAPALLASMESAVNCVATLATMGRSAKKDLLSDCIICPAFPVYNKEKLRLQPEWSIWDPDFSSTPRPDSVAPCSQAGSCGHCEPNATCSPVTGTCEACKPGWNGTQCKQPCPPGTFGERCTGQCPRCQLGEPCQAETGHCQRCDPGWLGHRCEVPCPLGTFGKGCSSTCPACVQGTCDAVTGECVCSAGYWGTRTATLPAHLASTETTAPSPANARRGSATLCLGLASWAAMAKAPSLVGILVSLLLLLVGVICCAYCYSVTRLDPKDRGLERNGAAFFRMKQQVWGALTSLGSALPCGSLSRYKLPWVTVSHHDPEVPFNHSFIEPPSAGWASDDSFSSDPDSGEEDEAHAYFMPPREETVPMAQEESPEVSLPGGPFPPPEDASTPFPIPRTSSLARAKRPSVSFAEGTKFAPQNDRSSGDLSSPIRKPKRLSRGAQPRPEGQEAEESTGPEQANPEEAAPTASSSGDAAASHGQLGSQTVAECVETTDGGTQESSGSVATIYMLAGTPQKPEGPVWSVFRRLGNYQKDQAAPKVKSAIPKPLRRSLGRNQASSGLSQSSGSAPAAMLSGVMESAAVRPEEAPTGPGDGTESLGAVQEPDAGSSSPEQGSQKQAEEKEQEEPLYENVVPMSVPPQH